ncbi:MAG: hypothetical protein IKZ34_03365 [Alphaproteobacteria bacterium]|nr:hypothetical protein [Alphaproteobacteria bacterium]
MVNERENFYQPLTLVDYDIAGNSFRAYYDADKKLVFVIDFLVTDIKPNVLLVINPVGDRKWDDILENDYGVDLETVRPKKDNKYQKLDIEYAGLAQYDNLIQAHEAGKGLEEALNDLVEFRHVAAVRSAKERQGAAELTASRSRETIDKTNEKITELQNRVKTLRQKLSEAKKLIGKEPTKQSASKILRLESQIDSTNDKLKRAKKRLNNAQHRLAAAEEEIEIAQSILDKLDVNLPTSPAPVDVVVAKPAPVPAEINEIQNIEPKAEEMADEEVKPLFDTEPNIMDEEIAFKPINFGAPVVQSEPEVPAVVGTNNVAHDVDWQTEADSDEELAEEVEMPYVDLTPAVKEQESVVQPLSFVPPVDFTPDDVHVETTEEIEPTPLLDGFTPFTEFEEERQDDDGKDSETDYLPEIKPVQDVLEPVVAPVYNYEEETHTAVVPSDLRPVSPIASEEPVVAESAPVVAPVVAPIAPVATSPAKPTKLYYILLLVLIVLSVFTLWAYQKTTPKAMPELGAKAEPMVEAVVEEEKVEEPVAEVAKEEVAPVKEVEAVTVAETKPEAEPAPVTESVSAPAPEPAPAPVVEPAVVEVTEPVVTTVVEAEVVPVTEPKVEEAPVVQEQKQEEPKAKEKEVKYDSPFIDLGTLGPVIGPVVVEEPEKEVVKVPSEEEVLAAKPAYGVSSKSEEMFVTAPNYETDVVVAPPADIASHEVLAEETVVEQVEPGVVTEYTEELVVEENLCADENPPDMNGCCSGEEFVVLPDGQPACCAIGTEDCFPPLGA